MKSFSPALPAARLLSRAFVALLLCLVLPVIASAQLQNGEFNSLDGWFPFGGVDISITNDAYRGGNACQVRNRSLQWHGIAQDVFQKFEPGKDYHVTSRIKLIGSTDKIVQLQLKQVDDRGERFFMIGEIKANDSGWTLLEAGFNYQSNGPTTELLFIFNASQEDDFEFDFLIDSVTVEEFDWKAAANARIEQHRKRDARLTFANQNGNNAAGLEVDVKLVNHHFGFGSTMSADIVSNRAYQDFFKRHFNRATMEFQSQWHVNEPIRGVENYDIADASVEFARANGIKLKGHAYIYPHPLLLPNWVSSLSGAEIQSEIEERMTNIGSRYAGQLDGWEVVNEMLEEDLLSKVLGDSYRSRAFRRAREIDPGAVLYANEYSLEYSTLKSQNYRKLVEGLVADGADIGVIGLQSHYFDYVSPKGMDLAVSELAKTGIDIYFTEFDITNSDEWERANALESFYRYAFSRPEAIGITMWGFWANSHWRGPDASLINSDWSVNAAGQRYFDLMNEWTTSFSRTAQTGGAIQFRGFHGDYLVTTVDSQNSVTNYHLVVLPEGNGTSSQTLQVNSVDGSLMVYGTAGDDLFEFDYQNPDRVVLNGEVIIFDLPVDATSVRFVGGAGNDRLETQSEPVNQNFVFLDQQLAAAGEQATEFSEEVVDAFVGQQSMELTDEAAEALVGLFRITSNWDPSTSYLARGAFFSNETSSYQPDTSHLLTELNEQTQGWASMRWAFELVSPGEYRIRCQWGSETGYLTRQGVQDDFGIWQPGDTVLLTSLQPEWSSQRWALIPTGDGGNMLINMWGPSDGVLTREAAGQNDQGQYIPGSSVRFHPPQDWSSQVWNLSSAN